MRCLGLLLVLVLGAHAVSLAATVYTYDDDDGTVVMTDRLKNVPPRFRDEVRVIEQDAPPPGEIPAPLPEAPDPSPPAPVPSAGRVEAEGERKGWSEFFWSALPERIVPGLTQYQSVLLIGGGVIGAAVFAAMMLTRNPALQFALKWVLIFVAGGTFYGIYFAELGTTLSVKGEERITDPRTVLDRVRVKVNEIEERQQERIQTIEHMEQLDALEGLDQR